MKHAIFAGSFDPFTNGHLWTLEQGLRLFDRITIAVGVNPQKHPILGTEERCKLIARIVTARGQVSVEHFSGELLVEYAQRIGATCILRGLRNTHDFVYEQRMAHLNLGLAPSITTMHVLAPPHLMGVSSTVVRGIVGLHHWERVVRDMVPPETLDALLEKYHDAH